MSPIRVVEEVTRHGLCYVVYDSPLWHWSAQCPRCTRLLTCNSTLERLRAYIAVHAASCTEEG